MRVLWLLQVLLVVLTPALIYGWVHRDEPSRALRGGGLVLVGTYTLLFATFFVGSVVTDPGGWNALAATAGWLIPVVALSLLAWRRPRQAAATLLVLVGGFAAVCVWSAVTPDWWTTFEDSNGPIRGLIALALATPIGVLGWQRPRIAGAMLIALPLLPTVAVAAAAVQGLGAQGWPIAALTGPAAIAGGAYLASTLVNDRPRARPAQRLTTSGARPS